MSTTEDCRSCRFSKTRPPGLMCRRYPPLDTDGRFPAVDPYDWCGEWMGMRPGHGLPVEIAPTPRRPAKASATHPDREGKGGRTMISAIVAFVCGLRALFGVFEPAMWRSGLALVSFACGLNTAIALVIMNGRRL